MRTPLLPVVLAALAVGVIVVPALLIFGAGSQTPSPDARRRIRCVRRAKGDPQKLQRCAR